MNYNIKRLLDRFENESITNHELTELELAIENGEVTIEQIQALGKMDQLFQETLFREVEISDDAKFEKLLVEVKNDTQTPLQMEIKPQAKRRNLFPAELLKMAGILFVGLALGFLISGQVNNDRQVESLSNQMSELKYQMMSSLLEQNAPQQRLKAVHLTANFTEVDSKVGYAMLNTLRHDESVNVRLAALEVLSKYSNNELVREGLIHSIRYQQSPLVQIRLAEVMANIQEEKALTPLEEWMNDQQLPDQFKSEFNQHLSTIKGTINEI